MSGFRSWIASLLGVSAYQQATDAGPSLGDPAVESLRREWNGQLSPVPYTQTRWLLKDLELAQHEADSGYLSTAAKLWNASGRDGVLSGVLSTRTAGLVQLPKRFRGDPAFVDQLELGHDSVRSVFDEMFPPNELAALSADGIGLGVGVAELMPVPGRSYPVMVRQPPENLVYWWTKNQWFYRSVAGLLPITPGDGHWMMHFRGQRIAPWQSQHVLWRPVGRSFINKEHAILHDANWQAKLANPARVAFSPKGASDDDRRGLLAKLMAWGINTAFALVPGWEIKLLESNGQGSQAFDRTVKRSEREMVIAVTGQEVTTDGGTGFQNANIYQAIRADLIKADGDALAYTLNTQGLPVWTVMNHGIEALDRSPCVAWDTTPPRDRAAESQALTQFGTGVQTTTDALRPYGYELDVDELANRFGLPLRKARVQVPATVETTGEDVSSGARGDGDGEGGQVVALPAREAA